ncbi:MULTISPECIES: glycerate kinase [Dietzia]|uniref:Glycerate kinase n=1 Tax=Dietzia maris TaxID=37915 RepID=A0A365P9H7_9ACTN|nr:MULTISPECIES: glycerate kinase [Dietzia]MCT1434487.1 glycerate kinase [Dietzia maris]MCT1520959.1 glycerate kinase [Dietzia maris]MCZ4539957.1 glycerate kinase [Dietzia maris]MCZ4654405.1 glycerate kinase [Dietzia kunjamensis]MDJ0421841.1 glycerate kinase [Dietzia kunjamensis]
MTIVVACGAFKGSLTAVEACHHAAEGARRAHPDTDVLERPVADGGGGSLEVMVAGGARTVPVTASGPTGEPVETSFAAIDPDTAFVEMADACGLLRLPGGEARPLEASSRGVGEVMLAALRSGRGNIHLGIGGSASTDGGAGMLAALGARFLDSSGTELPDGGGALVNLDRIDLDGLDPAVRAARILVACDVDNPLLGPLGAARVYGPQKGAIPDQLDELEAGLTRLVRVLRAQGLDVDPDAPGSGAAGGVGFIARELLGASLDPGFEVLGTLTGLEDVLSAADLVITGEGRLDDQTMHGKTPMGVAALCRSHAVPVVAVCGRLDLGADRVAEAGFAAAAALTEREPDLARSIANAGPLLEEVAAEVVSRILP